MYYMIKSDYDMSVLILGEGLLVPPTVPVVIAKKCIKHSQNQWKTSSEFCLATP